jgi:hypothetical protein
MSRFDWMYILTAGGVVETLVLTDAEASTIGSYWNAVRWYLFTGDTSRLDNFDGAAINAQPLLTDPDLIDRWDAVGELEIDSIYVTGDS